MIDEAKSRKRNGVCERQLKRVNKFFESERDRIYEGKEM